MFDGGGRRGVVVDWREVVGYGGKIVVGGRKTVVGDGEVHFSRGKIVLADSKATATEFIENGDLERHINRMRNYYRKQRKIILDAIAARMV